MKIFLIVCITAILFVMLIIFKEYLVFKQKYGEFKTVESNCIANTDYCLDGGNKVQTTYCVPNETTGFGCLNDDYSQILKNTIKITPCKPTCKKDIFVLKAKSLCEYSQTDLTNGCTLYNNGTQEIVEECTSFDETGISNCVPGPPTVTFQDCKVTTNILPPCGYYYTTENNKIIKCSDSEDQQIINMKLVTDFSCYTKNSNEQMNDIAFYDASGYLNPEETFKCSSAKCIESDLQYCKATCTFVGTSEIPLIKEIQESVYNFWATTELVGWKSKSDNSNNIRRYLIVSQTEKCQFPPANPTLTPENQNLYRNNFYNNMTNHENVYGECINPNSSAGEIDFAEIRYLDLYPGNTSDALFDVCSSVINTCDSNAEILATNSFQYNNGIIFTIIPITIDQMPSSNIVLGTFCIVAHSYGMTYALSYSGEFTLESPNHKRFVLKPFDYDDVSARRNFAIYGTYTKTLTSNFLFLNPSEPNGTVLIPNKFNTDFKNPIEGEESLIQFELVKLNTSDSRIKINGEQCVSGINVTLLNKTDKDLSC